MQENVIHDDDRNQPDEAWIERYLSNETTVVNTKDLYCAMLHLLCYRADLLRNEATDFLACSLCKLSDSPECAQHHRQHINNIAHKIGLDDSPLILPREYRVHIDSKGNAKSDFKLNKRQCGILND